MWDRDRLPDDIPPAIAAPPPAVQETSGPRHTTSAVDRHAAAARRQRWSSFLAIGVPEIERQHAELLRSLEELADAIAERDAGTIRAAFDRFRGGVADHFAYEESLMQGSYRGHLAHKEAHDAFEETVDGFRHLAAAGDEASLQQMVDWLKIHIGGYDKELGRHLASNRAPRDDR